MILASTQLLGKAENKIKKNEKTLDNFLKISYNNNVNNK